MQQLERRVQKIEELIYMKYGQVHPECKNMTEEEVDRLVYDTLNGPVKVLFIRTRNGFVDVYPAGSQQLARALATFLFMSTQTNAGKVHDVYEAYTDDE